MREQRVRPPEPVERSRRDALIATIVAVLVVGSVGALIGISLVRHPEIPRLGPTTRPPIGPTGPLPTAIASGFRMPHQDEPTRTRSDDPAAPSAFQPCDGPDVTRSGRIDAATTTGPGAAYEYQRLPTRLVEQLLLYDGLTSAREALTGLGRRVHECGWLGGLQDDTTYGVPAVVATKSRPDGKEFAMVTLWGNTLIVKYANVSGQASFFPDAESTGQIGDQICATMGLRETVRCFEPVASPSRPAYHTCPPTVAPRPATGPSASYPKPSGISPTPRPS